MFYIFYTAHLKLDQPHFKGSLTTWPVVTILDSVGGDKCGPPAYRAEQGGAETCIEKDSENTPRLQVGG